MIQGTFREEDMLAAQRLHLRPRRAYAVAGLLILALALWGSWMQMSGALGQDLDWTRWVVPASLLYFAAAYWIWLPYRARRSFRQRKDFRHEVRYTVSQAGMSVQAEHAQGNKPWDDYLKWKEGKQVFLLYLSDNMFQVMPKHFFGGAAEIDAFRALLEQHVPRAKS